MDYLQDNFKLESKEPLIIGDKEKFLILGKIGCRGDKFVVLISLETGKTYIEEAFTTTALGTFSVGLNYIEDEGLWNSLVYAANSYGLTSSKHILKCLQKLGIKTNLPLLEHGKL